MNDASADRRDWLALPAPGPLRATLTVPGDKSISHRALILGGMAQGVTVDDERLSAASVSLLRSGTRNAWLEVQLDEGRNRHIRRLLQAFELPVLRLVPATSSPPRSPTS